jgi:hypothetical protein
MMSGWSDCEKPFKSENLTRGGGGGWKVRMKGKGDGYERGGAVKGCILCIQGVTYHKSIEYSR